MTIPIVATYIPRHLHNWSVLTISLDLQNFFFFNLSQETIPRSPHCVVSDNEPVVSPQMVSYIKNYTVSQYNKIQYLGDDDNEVATSEISVLDSGDEEITEVVSTKHKYYN